MSTGMLSKFHVRNLRSSSQPAEERNSFGSLVRISAPAYDMTISNNSAATLKYRDEDGDKITLGSSHELIDKLEEPMIRPSANSSRRNKDRMSIAMLLSEVQQDPDAVNHHTFDIEEREDIQKLWQEIQRRNRTPPPLPSSTLAERSSSGLRENIVRSRELSKEALSLKEVAEEVVGGSPDPSGPGTETVVESMNKALEDQKDMLAVAYEKLKARIWTTVAAEIGTSWEEAEALHWAVGRDEMIRRAERVAEIQCNSSEGLESVKSTDGDWHENRKSSIQPPVNICTVQKFEEYRKHHFNATMPPQMRHAVSANQAGTKFTQSKLPYAGIAKSAPSKDTFPSLVATPSANLTTEGKRQAQAAGDILRSRTTPSRHRKAINTTTDHTKHQNRWASYKSPGTTFSPETSTTSSKDCSISTLTPEGRRQAQAAGDKLRSRTNPIRHSRPRSGSVEHGVNKNRWASYVGPRVARDEAHPLCTTEPNQEVKSKKPDTKEEVMQPSLLEVFEAELAKSFLEPDAVPDEGPAPEPEVVDIPSAKPKLGSPTSHLSSASTPTRVASPNQKPSAPISGVELINDCIQRLTSAGGAQEFSQAVDHGLRSATGAIEALVLGVPARVQHALSQCEQSGALQQHLEINGIDNAFNSLRDFMNNIGANSDGPQASERVSATNIETTSNASDGMHTHPTPRNTSEIQGHVADTIIPSPGEEHDSPADAGCKVSNNTRQAPSSPSDNRVAQQANLDDSSNIRGEGKSSAPQYQNPGPIHLPNVTQSPSDMDLSHGGYRNSDLWQHNDTFDTVDDPAAGPNANTRFPTLAQFEGQNFAASSSFPALPSMEPLVPQQARTRSVTDKFDMQASGNLKATDAFPKTQQNPNSTAPATQRWGLTDTSPGRPTPIRFSTHAVQSPAGKQKSLAASHLAKLNERQQRLQDFEAKTCPDEQQSKTDSSEVKQEQTLGDTGRSYLQPGVNSSSQTLSRSALEDYQIQPKLLEEQNKQRLLMARMEQNRIEIGRSNPQAGVNPTSQKRPRHALQDYQIQLKLLEEQNKKRLLMARMERSRIDSDLANSHTPDFAARLAEPFNPLDAEPSAQPHLTRGIRRNATTNGPAPEHNARRRRPYSDAFHGSGRGTRGSFEGGTADGEDEIAKLQGNLPSRRRDQATQDHDKHQQRQGQLNRSATLHEWRPTSSLRESDDANANKINACVKQLRDLGFGDGKPDSGDRLLVFAQASEGDLVEAIDMIDEEQRAYRSL